MKRYHAEEMHFATNVEMQHSPLDYLQYRGEQLGFQLGRCIAQTPNEKGGFTTAEAVYNEYGEKCHKITIDVYIISVQEMNEFLKKVDRYPAGREIANLLMGMLKLPIC